VGRYVKDTVGVVSLLVSMIYPECVDGFSKIFVDITSGSKDVRD